MYDRSWNITYNKTMFPLSPRFVLFALLPCFTLSFFEGFASPIVSIALQAPPVVIVGWMVANLRRRTPLVT
jgi:hypothetical protein